MSSFLAKKKTLESYEEKISTEPKATRQNKMYAVTNFTKFVKSHYEDRTVEDVIAELRIIKKEEVELKYEEAIYGMLQDWINWNEKEGRGNYSIRITFSNLRKFLYHLGIKTSQQDIRENLRFGKKIKEEKHALSQS